MKCKFSTIGANEEGTRIFCKFTCEGKNVVRGFYDFDLEKFIIIKYIYDNFPKGVSKNMIKKELRKELIMNYDWDL